MGSNRESDLSQSAPPKLLLLHLESPKPSIHHSSMALSLSYDAEVSALVLALHTILQQQRILFTNPLSVASYSAVYANPSLTHKLLHQTAAVTERAARLQYRQLDTGASSLQHQEMHSLAPEASRLSPGDLAAVSNALCHTIFRLEQPMLVSWSFSSSSDTTSSRPCVVVSSKSSKLTNFCPTASHNTQTSKSLSSMSDWNKSSTSRRAWAAPRLPNTAAFASSVSFVVLQNGNAPCASSDFTASSLVASLQSTAPSCLSYRQHRRRCLPRSAP